MALVILVAVLLAAVRIRRLGIDNRQRADHHGYFERAIAFYAAKTRHLKGFEPEPLDVSRTSYYAKRVAYHAALRRKYERAARDPWLPVPPDPPPPE